MFHRLIFSKFVFFSQKHQRRIREIFRRILRLIKLSLQSNPVKLIDFGLFFKSTTDEMDENEYEEMGLKLLFESRGSSSKNTLLPFNIWKLLWTCQLRKSLLQCGSQRHRWHDLGRIPSNYFVSYFQIAKIRLSEDLIFV